MAPRRVYSDPAVNGVVSNILQMINGSPEQALQQAELAKQVVGIDAARGQLDARDRLAQAFTQFTGPDSVQPLLGNIYANSFQGDIDPSKISAAILGYTANAGGTNAQNAASMVGAGHAIRPGDAYTVPRQDELALTEERVGDERQASALANAFGIARMHEKGTNNRFYNTPVKAGPGDIITAFDESHNPTVYHGNKTPAVVQGDIMGRVAAGQEITPEQKSLLRITGGGAGGAGPVPLDVSPADLMGDTSLSTIVDSMIGDGSEIDDNLKISIIQRAAEIYQQTRNSGGAVKQAIAELTQKSDVPGMLYGAFGSTPTYSPKTPSAPAAPAAPATPAPQPQVVQGKSGPVENEIQQSTKDPSKYRIWRNGQWQNYNPAQQPPPM